LGERAKQSPQAVKKPACGSTTSSPATGRAIVLLPGFPETWREWRAVIPALVQAGFRLHQNSCWRFLCLI
jgi:pimeloyl-ACP methyl ester carboxylesterase